MTNTPFYNTTVKRHTLADYDTRRGWSWHDLIPNAEEGDWTEGAVKEQVANSIEYALVEIEMYYEDEVRDWPEMLDDDESAEAHVERMVEEAKEELEDEIEDIIEWVKAEQEEARAERELNSIMTTAEVAEEFGVDPSTPKKAAQQGRIPARKSGDTWLVRRADAAKRWGKPLTLTLISLALGALGYASLL